MKFVYAIPYENVVFLGFSRVSEFHAQQEAIMRVMEHAFVLQATNSITADISGM